MGAMELDRQTSRRLNDLAREQMKLRLLADIRVDMEICEIEGWDKLEYIREICEMINDLIGK